MAKGIVLEIKEEGNWQPFNDVVANVDMRKFLKYFAEDYTKKTYAEITRDGNGMCSEDGWNLKDNLVIKVNNNCDDGNDLWLKLEHHRTILLDSMISPETPPKKGNVETSIDWFLGMENKGLHPAYLMYNYEAIAVNIRYNWGKERYKKISENFSSFLHERMENIFEEYTNKTINDTPKSILLLVERILDISRRIRYEWVLEYVPKVQTKLKLLHPQASKEKIIKRINTVLQQIEHSSF